MRYMVCAQEWLQKMIGMYIYKPAHHFKSGQLQSHFSITIGKNFQRNCNNSRPWQCTDWLYTNEITYSPRTQTLTTHLPYVRVPSTRLIWTHLPIINHHTFTHSHRIIAHSHTHHVLVTQSQCYHTMITHSPLTCHTLPPSPHSLPTTRSKTHYTLTSHWTNSTSTHQRRIIRHHSDHHTHSLKM